MKQKHVAILIGIILIAIIVSYHFGALPYLSVSSRVEGLSASKGNYKSGATTQLEEGENLVYGNYYEFVFEVYWEEEGDVADPYYKDERIAVIQGHLNQVNDLVWENFFANETLMEHVYPQYIKTTILSCSDLIIGPYGDVHYEITAESKVQTICIKNPISWLLVLGIVKLLIIAGIIVAVGYFSTLILRELCILVHGWPPAPPVAPPEWASEELWAKYYDAFKIYSATKTIENLIWYTVLGCICVGLIFLIVYYFTNKTGRSKIIKRITGHGKKKK